MDNNQSEPEVIEGEISPEDSSVDSVEPQNTATVSLNLESLIRGHLTSIDKLRVQVKELNDTINNILSSDPTYKDHSDKAKEASKVKSGTKSQIMKRPEVMQTVGKLNEARMELKDQQATLSDLLAEYQRTSGQDSIEMEDGRVKKIVFTAKLVS